MKVLLCFFFVALLSIFFEESSGFVRKRTSSRAKRVWNHGLRLKWKELREIHRRGPPGPTGPKKENLKAKKTEKNVKQSGPQTQSTKPTKFKKNEYFIDPKLYDKMRRVTSMKDFVEIFKPPGYSIKKELVKEPGRPGGLPGATGISGRKPDSLGPLGGGKGPIGPPGPDTFVAKDVIYFNSRKVADTLVEDPYKLGCALKSRNHLIPHKPGEFLLPRCINLKKCSGCCQLSMECVSTSTVNKTVPVFVIDGYNPPRSINMNFVEDSACKCDCIVKKADCYPKQTYSQARCQCECLLTPTACPTDKHWSTGECGCICSNRRICKSRTRKWNENTCRCDCITDPCPSGKVRNKESCRCTDAPVSMLRTGAKGSSPQQLKKGDSGAKSSSRALTSFNDDLFDDEGDDDLFDDDDDDRRF